MPTLPTETVTPDAPTRSLSDRDLLSRFLETRDEAAFGDVVSRHGGLVMAVAWRVLRDRHAAEDVFQATFLVLAQKAKAIRKVESLAAWLHGTTFRIARKSLARRQRRKECAMASGESVAKTLAETVRLDQQTAVDEELARLPESLRGPLVLRYLQDKSAPEIAEELGLSVTAIEGRLRRGRRKLQQRLVRRGIGLVVIFASGSAVTVPAEAAVSATLIGTTAKACTAAAAGAALPKLISTEVTQLAVKELIAMSKAGLLKTTLVWGAVGAGVTLTGLASTGHLLPTASAGGQGATAAAPASSGPGEVPIVATDVSVGDASGGGQPAAGVPAGPTPGYAPTAAAGAAPPDARNLPSPNTTSAAAPDGRAIPSSTEGQPPTPVAGSGAMMGEMMAPSTTEGRPQPPRIINYKSQSINEQRIHDALTRPVEFQFNGQTLGQVLQFIESVENVRIRLDEVALQDEGVGADSEINLAINGVSLENALNLMFESVNGVRLDYVIKNDVLTITTATKAENMIETRVYDVRNFDGMTPESLARVITHSVRPESWAMTVAETRELAETRKFLKANRGVSGGHGGAGAMSGMAGYPMGMGGGSPPPEEETPGHLGGGNGWIEPIGGALVITQSQVVHREIVELLEQLSRYAQASDGEAAPGMGQGGAGMSGMYGSMGGRRGSASGYGGAGSSPYGGSAYPTSGAQPRGSSPAPAYGAPAANPPGVAPQPATQPQEELPAASPQTSGRSPGSVYPGSSGTPAPSADPAAPTPDGAELPASRQK